jgi:hypothetical protein
LREKLVSPWFRYGFVVPSAGITPRLVFARISVAEMEAQVSTLPEKRFPFDREKTSRRFMRRD